MNTVDEIRLEKINKSRQLGDYYRAISLWQNGGYTELPQNIYFDISKAHSKKLIKEAIRQYGSLQYTTEGFIKIKCPHCGEVQIINNYDFHIRECEEHN